MRISLLSALPHSLADIQRGRGNPKRDYIRSSLRGFRDSARTIWSDVAPSLGSAAESLFRLCDELEIAVGRNAGREQLVEAAAESDVVIVLAHWKGPYVSLAPPDLTAPAHDLEACLHRCQRAGAVPEESRATVLNSPSHQKALDNLADSLNAAIDQWHKWVQLDHLCTEHADRLIVSHSYGMNHARTLLNGLLGEDNLLPGARLELDDGLWNPVDVAGCFGDDWRGICDFVCCTSEYLAEETKAQHPRALFRADSRFLHPGGVLEATSELLRRLRSGSDSHRSLSDAYMSIALDCDRKYGG